ncbi:MAG TPA: glycosyltransferase [Acidobacteriota bacterium]|nr:glycosyltransferase [Acidobacteriota bacterium]HNJ39993.1 glycosyltransferase [Acidobacteriota bacterium]
MASLALPQPQSDRKQITHQTSLLYAAQLTGTGLNFATTFLLARWMGVDNFSLFTFCSVSILTFVSLFFEFGMFSAGARLLAISKDETEENEVLGALLVLGLGLGLAMAIFIGVSAPFIDQIFRVQVRGMLWACLPLVLFIPLQFLLESACQGNNRISSLGLFRIALPGLTFLGAALVFAFFQLTPFGALLATNAGAAAACLLVIAFLRPSFHNLRSHVRAILDETRRFGIDVYLGRVTAIASQRADGLLIPYYIGYAPLGFYTIGKSIADSLIINFSRALAVTRFRSFARSHEVSNGVLVWNFLLLLVAGTALILVAPLLLGRFLPQYVQSADLLVPFVVGSILGGLLQPYNLFLAAHGRGGELRNISMFIGVVYLVALVLVIPWFGLLGAAWVIAAVAGLNFVLHRQHYLNLQRERITTGEIPLRVVVINLSGDTRHARAWAESLTANVELTLIDKARLREDSKLNWIRRLRQTPCDLFAIYCDRLEWQTLRIPMLLFGMLAGARTCLIVDSAGKELRRSALAVALWEIPHLALEVCGGAFLIGISWALTRYLELECRMAQSRTPSNPLSTLHHSTSSRPESLLFIRTTPTSGAQTGGATSHISGFTQGATALGVKVRFLSNDSISGVHPEVTPIKILWPSGFFSAHRVLFELWNNLVFTIRAIDEVKNDPPDYLYQRYSRFNWSGVVLSLSTGIPLLLEYNGSEVWIGRYWDDVQLLWLLEAFEMLNLQAAASVFVVSEVERQNLLERGIPDTKILVNPNGVNPDIFHSNCGGTAVRHQLGLEKQVVVGFVGTFGPWHGVEVIAKAATLLPSDSPLHFVMIGEGALKSTVEEQVQKTGVSHRFTFTGRIGHNRVAAYLDACDILVSPQVQREDGGEFFGSPTKLFEYMAMEKGVIASRVGQIGQILEHEKTALLIPPGDAQALADACERLARNPQFCRDLGSAARTVVSGNYTWKHNAQRVLDRAASLQANSQS